MTSNLPQFLREFRTVAQGLPERELIKFQKLVTLQALQRVVARTPVDTGHARSNWQVTIGAPSTNEVPGDRQPDAQLTEAISRLAALGPYTVTFVANPVPYVEVLDRGRFVPPNPGPSSDPRPGRTGRILVQGGYSVQAPQGIVAVTVQELRAQFPGNLV